LIANVLLYVVDRARKSGLNFSTAARSRLFDGESEKG